MIELISQQTREDSVAQIQNLTVQFHLQGPTDHTYLYHTIEVW